MRRSKRGPHLSSWRSLHSHRFTKNATYTVFNGSDPSCTNCIDTGDARISSAAVQSLANGNPAIVVPVNVGLGSSGTKGTQVIAVVQDLSTLPPTNVLMSTMKTSPNGAFYYSSAVLTGDGQALVLQNEGSVGGNTGKFPYDQVSVANFSGKVTRAVIKTGSAVTHGNIRWGDYSSAVPDPVAGNGVWTLGSYLGANPFQQSWWMDITR